MRKLSKMIIHCSDSDIKSHDNVETIREWHKQRGWKDVGYHFFIQKNGTIEKGRPIEVQGAHCAGQNKDSIGICLSGSKEFTNDQFISLGSLLQVLQLEFGDMSVHPHRQFNDTKTCPNFDSHLFDN